MDELSTRLRRQAVRMEIGGFRPQEAPTASWFGRVLLAGPGEVWPTTGGQPMHALFQLNVADLPYRPPLLQDVALLTAFVGPSELPIGQPNGTGWRVRTYRTLADLVPIVQAGGSLLRAFPMRARPVEEDFPCAEDVPSDLAGALKEARREDPDAFPNLDGFKIGGWPTLIQSEIHWGARSRHPAQPEFALQVDSESKANWAWGDNGIGYFGRGTGEGFRDEWTLQWQCL